MATTRTPQPGSTLDADPGLNVQSRLTYADYVEHGDGERRFLKPQLDHFGLTPLRAIGQHEIDLVAKKLLPKAANSSKNRTIYTKSRGA
jgi:hypothetical protein